MFTAILRSQWVYSRTTVLAFALLAFATPLGAVVFAPAAGHDPAGLVVSGEVVGGVVLTVTMLVATVLASQSWSIDARLGHVYALSLPIARSRYVTYRLLALGVLNAIVAAALLLGGLAAGAMIQLPTTLRTYPASLAVRALLCGWLITSGVVMGLWMSGGERLPRVVLALLIFLILLPLLLQFTSDGQEVLRIVGEFVRTHPGPLGLLLGRWTFIDV